MSRLCFNDCCVRMVCCRCEYCWQFVRVTYRSTIWQLFCTFPQFNKMVLFFLYESRNLEPYFNFFKMINYQLLSNLLHKTVKSFKKGIYLVQCKIWLNIHISFKVFWHTWDLLKVDMQIDSICSKMSKGHFIWFWGCIYSITM